VLLLAALAAPASLAAASQPTWTAKGSITALKVHSITVHGQTCRITTASPTRATLRLYFVGASAKIACANGVLRTIDVFKVAPASIILAPPNGSGTFTASATGNPNLLLTQTFVTLSSGLISSSNSLAGGAPITTLTDTSISAGGGTVSLTCSIGAGSPDLGGLAVGDRITRMICKNGVLMDLTRAG
jgi:hypothetical protein